MDDLAAGRSAGVPKPTSARRTISLSLTATGRATRTEVISYVIAAVIVQIAGSVAGAIALEIEPRQMLGNAMVLLIALPMPALIARRCHDQDRTGSWAWLAALAFAIWALRSAVSALWGYETRITFDSYTWPLDLLATAASVVTLLLLLLPGTKGPNRFGADPRVRE